ncbi:RNA polymerase-associated protein RTF1 homolog [Eurytemora carolleeae]|uniref:RNA polymerase-associated protein RTF1 homolog n=1 Tax=Eurytemora carolleeae TaxID=1294199 RepID=UPI000C757DCB|nr:RNA polymerase-associated protein RTF1 homolog [Eurytemora carolleeae]|eukprot:XP_023324636.1 RNA polymerase-associated protein RTF1 homolog [Eurytemora affinis]
MLEDMTEREREEELYKRAEKREELKKRFEISQKLKKQNKNKNLERRESGSDEGELREDREDREDRDDAAYLAESGSRKKGYEEKYGSKFNALSELKAKREEKERKEKMREEKQKKKSRKKESESESGSDYEKLGRRKKKKVLKASEIYSSSSSDDGDNVRRKTSSEHSSSSVSSISESGGESDTERQNSKKTVKKAMHLDTVEELEKIRLSRFKLDKFCHLPCFKKTVVGCFVRIGIGKNAETNKDVYRCCEIMDICETGKVYNVMKTKTNIGLKLRFGKDTRIFRLQFVSNQAFKESEFTNWKKACHEGNILLPTVAHREQKEKDIKYALEYRFSSYDVEKILASKGKFNQSPKNFAMYKAKLMKERDMAETAGDTEKVAKLTQDLDTLEEKAEDLDRKRTSTISTISLINDRNRKNNVARAYTGIQADEERRRREGDIDDPFTRRKTKPKLGFAGKNKEPEMTSELLKKLELEKAKSEKKEKEKTPLSILPPPVDISKLAGSKDMSGIRPKLDIFDAHNFELDINVDGIQATPVTPSINLKPVTAIETPAGPLKRSLKLDEWKKKRGII